MVLGGAVRDDDRPSPTLCARLDAAAEAFFAGQAPRIIVTGFGEAEPMQRYLVARGIPPEQIELERHARSTRENAREVARMVPEGAALLIVTQRAHLRRALALFRGCGVEVTGLAAGRPFGLYAALRERLVYVHHRWRGWV